MSAGPEVRCACGALNDVSFDTCIRCRRVLRRDGTVEPGSAALPIPEAAGAAKRSIRPAAEEEDDVEDDDDESPRPAMWSSIIVGGICALVFASEWAMAARRGDGMPLSGGGTFGDMLRAGMLRISPKFIALEPFRFVSAGFVHFGLIHFVLNMSSLFYVGAKAERMVGPSRTVMAFVVTSIFGFATSAAWQLMVVRHQIDTGGASAGVLGVMGLVFGVMLRTRHPDRLGFGLQVVLVSVVFGFALSSGSSFSVNNAAHVGGLLSGMVLGLGWGYRTAREGWLSKAFAATMIILSVASLAAARQSDLAALY